MTRFDIGVMVVTFVALGLIAVFRHVVVPIVRLRVARHRAAAGLAGPSEDMLQLPPEGQQLSQRGREPEKDRSTR